MKLQETSLDNYEFKLNGAEKPFEGYVSAKDKTVVGPRTLIRGSLNTYKKLSGNIAPRPGLKRRGTADATDAGVKSSYVWNSSIGITRPLRVCNGKLQVEFNSGTTYTWVDLLDSSGNQLAASLTRFSFDTWWSASLAVDLLLFVRGDTDIFYWRGGVASVSAQAAGGSTLALQDTTKTFLDFGFYSAAPSSNTSTNFSFYINGSTTKYTYVNGNDTNTLANITPALPAINDGDIITSVVDTVTDPASSDVNNDMIKVLNNQVFVASYTARLVSISADTDFSDFTNAGSLIFGDPDFVTLDKFATGMAIKDGSMWVSSGDSEWNVLTPNTSAPVSYTDPNAPGGSASRFVFTKREKKSGAGLTAALAHEFIDTIGDTIVYLGQDNQVRYIGTFKNIFSNKYPSLSQVISDELSQEDFIGGQLKVVGDFIHITAPISGKDYMHQVREYIDIQGNITAERLWHPTQARGVSRFEVIDGILYGHSNVNPQIYQIWDTEQWFDDSPTDDEVSYTAIARFGYANAKRRQGLISFDKVYYEGYLDPGTQLFGNIYYDYRGSEKINPVVINGLDTDPAARLFEGQMPPSIGDASLGDDPLGVGLSESAESQELLPKFRAIRTFTPTDVFEYALEVYSTIAGSRWEILCLGTNEKLSTNQAVQLGRTAQL